MKEKIHHHKAELLKRAPYKQVALWGMAAVATFAFYSMDPERRDIKPSEAPPLETEVVRIEVHSLRFLPQIVLKKDVEEYVPEYAPQRSSLIPSQEKQTFSQASSILVDCAVQKVTEDYKVVDHLGMTFWDDNFYTLKIDSNKPYLVNQTQALDRITSLDMKVNGDSVLENPIENSPYTTKVIDASTLHPGLNVVECDFNSLYGEKVLATKLFEVK